MGDNPSDNESDHFGTSDDESENGKPSIDTASVAWNGSVANSVFCEASSSAGPSNSMFRRQFVAMGFPEKLISRALKENGHGDEDTILGAILTYAALENSPTRNQDAETTLSKEPDFEFESDLGSGFSSSDNDQEICEENLLEDSDSFDNKEGILTLYSPSSSMRSKTLKFLEDMNFPKEEILIAFERCGPDASEDELTNCILAAQMARADDPYYVDPPAKKSKIDFKKKKISCSQPKICDEDQPIRLPKPMVGFGVPTGSYPTVLSRTLPNSAIGPPYFYYENVALAPKGSWDDISRFLFDVEPEFVDSKYFCAAARKRGYIHNLPIVNRFAILPLPPRTIHDAFPLTKRWWPEWDTRTKLNCLQTAYGSAKMTGRIHKKLREWPGDPPAHVKKYVLEECRKWNLLWVGRNKVATLEPDEVEMLLGFPKSHTRGISRTDRYKSLGNSFQVDTVAYHLSVLKEIFPNGIKVLSLFSGIGGGEVAMHRLGIQLNLVVSVELNEVSQNVVRSWWEQTNQKGILVHLSDINDLTRNKLDELMSMYGGFDFVIGGSPCNNLAGSNRVSRDGLEGKQSSLFFDYVRILEYVMASRR